MSWLSEIRKSLNFNGKHASAYLLSLLVAFGIWFFHGLSVHYTEIIRVPVSAQCSIDGHSAFSADEALVSARCTASGFEILRFSRAASARPLSVEFSRSDLRSAGGESFYVLGTDLLKYSSRIFGDNATVSDILTDTLFFRFPSQQYRKVPVQPVCSMSFRQQYTDRGGLRLSPDSVMVYGDPLHLESIERVFTESFALSDLRASAHGKVNLQKISGVRLSSPSVEYTVDVQRFVQIKATVPVKVRNAPRDRGLIVYPSSAEVYLRCTFPISSDPTELLSLYVDYNDFTRSLSGECLPHLGGLSSGIIDFEIRPQVFSCVESER